MTTGQAVTLGLVQGLTEFLLFLPARLALGAVHPLI